MKITAVERKNLVNGLNSRLVNLQGMKKMENRFDEASQNSLQRGKKDRKYERDVQIYEEQD